MMRIYEPRKDCKVRTGSSMAVKGIIFEDALGRWIVSLTLGITNGVISVRANDEKVVASISRSR